MAGTRPPTWTEPTIESAIDTLANLTSVQGRTITLADANLDVLWGWDDSAAAYDNFALADITNEASPANGDFVLLYGAEGDLRRTDWANLPGAGGGINNVVEDTSPELGGSLESNNFDISMEQYSADALEASIFFQKSRNASIGSHTVVQSGDALGTIYFMGSDGTNFETAALIKAAVDGTPGNNDMPGHMSFWTTPDASVTPVERLRITQVGAINAGEGAPPISIFGVTPRISANVSSADAYIGIHTWNASPLGSALNLATAKSNTVGTYTALAAEDFMGAIHFGGADGDQFIQGAAITTVVDGTPANNDMPGRLSFWTTADGAAGSTERLRIDSAGRVHIGDGAIQTTMFSGTCALEIDQSGSDFGGDIAQYHYGANANGTAILVHKARSTSFGVVSSGDALGSIWWAGADGDQWVVGANIAVVVDATPGNNDMPTRMEFGTTADAGTFPTTRLTIKNDGRLVAANGAIPHFWVYWTANSTTILASYNMTSIADTGVGDADGTIATDFASANWAGFVATNDTTAAWDAANTQGSGFNARAAGTFGVLCSTITDGGTAVASLTDPDQWQVVGFGVSA